MTGNGIYEAVRRRTRLAFGFAINLHRFRHAAATFWSSRDPKNVRGANGRLRKVVADLTLDKEMLQEVIRRKLYDACSGTRRVDPQGLPSNSGMPRDLSLPFPPTRAGAPQPREHGCGAQQQAAQRRKV